MTRGAGRIREATVEARKRMPRWEFAYVDLWLGTNKEVAAVLVQQQRIAEMGAEGWEPVGRVTFSYRTPNLIIDTNVSQLMFKRLLDEA